MDYVLDSGILLRLLEQTDKHHKAILRAVGMLIDRNDRLYATLQTVAEFWSVSTRPANARGGFGLSLERTERRLRVIERIAEILPEPAAAYAQWRTLVSVHGVSGVKVHDARLVATMVTQNVPRILTLNIDDFQRYSEITPLTPEDVLASRS